MDKEYLVDYQRILVTMSLLHNVEDSDYTQQHSLRTGRLVKKISQELGLDKDTINLVTRAAYFHDVGKIKLSKAVLFKIGRLTDDDFTEMKLHPRFSREVLLSFKLEKEAEIALQHHERLNGKGYPDGLAGNEINGLAKILAVADVYDAMTTDRPYRKGITAKESLLHLYSVAEEHFNLEIIQALHIVLEKERKIKKTLDI